MSAQLSRSAAVCLAVMFLFTLWAATVTPVQPMTVAAMAQPTLA